MKSIISQGLNFLLATAMWFVIGRMFMGLFIKNQKNPVWQFFLLITEPVYKVSRFLTANRVSDKWLGLISIIWLITARILIVFFL